MQKKRLFDQKNVAFNTGAFVAVVVDQFLHELWYELKSASVDRNADHLVYSRAAAETSSGISSRGPDGGLTFWLTNCRQSSDHVLLAHAA